MNNYGAENVFGEYDSVPTAESERLPDEYRTFEFEAMTEVPMALAVYVLHQYLFDL